MNICLNSRVLVNSIHFSKRRFNKVIQKEGATVSEDILISGASYPATIVRICYLIAHTSCRRVK